MKIQINARNRAYQFSAAAGEKILHAGLANGVNLENWFSLTDNDDGTTTLEQALTATGALNDDDAAGIRAHGDMTLHADALRKYLKGA